MTTNTYTAPRLIDNLSANEVENVIRARDLHKHPALKAVSSLASHPYLDFGGTKLSDFIDHEGEATAVFRAGYEAAGWQLADRSGMDEDDQAMAESIVDYMLEKLQEGGLTLTDLARHQALARCSGDENVDGVLDAIASAALARVTKGWLDPDAASFTICVVPRR